MERVNLPASRDAHRVLYFAQDARRLRSLLTARRTRPAISGMHTSSRRRRPEHGRQGQVPRAWGSAGRKMHEVHGTGRPLVLLHGAFGWATVYPGLAKDCQVIINRGAGATAIRPTSIARRPTSRWPTSTAAAPQGVEDRAGRLLRLQHGRHGGPGGGDPASEARAQAGHQRVPLRQDGGCLRAGDGQASSATCRPISSRRC